MKFNGETLVQNGDFLNFYVTDSVGNMRAYRAFTFHFHSLAEHTLDSKRADLEMHIVCDETEDSLSINHNTKRPLGVIAFLFN